ncbi:MAG: RraA family protein [Burkholderiaceae bacterium]|nr:RraA family protein [Burkholderiaceae bacterium]
MIDEAPPIRIATDLARPTPEEVALFRDVQTGVAVDALGGRGALDHQVKPLFADQSILCGVALTCDAGAADNLAVTAALTVAREGDVIVAAAGGHMGCAVVGDLVMGMMRNNGVIGFVTDGCVRDTRGIRGVGLPCFASGVSPNSPARNGPGTVGEPIVVGGVTVCTGDLIVADEDGVVVIPRAQIGSAAKRLDIVRRNEAALEARVKAGLRQFDR